MISRRGSILNDLAAFFFMVAFCWIQFGGIYHSATKHSSVDLILALTVPPFAWYRSIEFFWHDDFAHINWDQRVKGDIKAIVEIVNNEIESKNMLDNANNKEFLHNRIKTYPAIQKDRIEQAVIGFMNYHLQFAKEMCSIAKMTAKENYSVWTESNEMKKQRSLFAAYYTDSEMQMVQETLEKEVKKFQKALKEEQISTEKIQEIEKNFGDLERVHKEKYQECFKSIFDKEISL